jgi:hypothetical protein
VEDGSEWIEKGCNWEKENVSTIKKPRVCTRVVRRECRKSEYIHSVERTKTVTCMSALESAFTARHKPAVDHCPPAACGSPLPSPYLSCSRGQLSVRTILPSYTQPRSLSH